MTYESSLVRAILFQCTCFKTSYSSRAADARSTLGSIQETEWVEKSANFKLFNKIEYFQFSHYISRYASWCIV